MSRFMKPRIHLVEVTCVGVIWFVLQLLQLLPCRFAQRNSCCISKSMMGARTVKYRGENASV